MAKSACQGIKAWHVASPEPINDCHRHTKEHEKQHLVERLDDVPVPARGVRIVDQRHPDSGMAHGSDNEENNRGDHVCGTGLGS